MRSGRKLGARFCLWTGAFFLVACAPAREVPGESLRVLVAGAGEELDPRFVADPHSLRLTRLIYSSLVRMDPITLEPVLDLASEIVESKPGTYQVRLQPKLVFSDGAPLTAVDVVATYQSVTDPALGSRYAGTYRRIVSVNATGPLEIEFELDGPHATFLTDLELPILRAKDATHHIRWRPETVGSVVGAGPYQLESFSPHHVLLVANPRWHGGANRFPRVRLDVLRDENTRALRLLSGEADLALQALGPQLVDRIASKTAYEVATAPGINTFYLGFHTRAAGLREVKVRRAIAHALDRELLLRSELSGRGAVARSLVPDGHWADDRTIQPPEFDPKKARALLEEVGLPTDGRAVPRVLVLRVSSDRARVSLAKAIAGMLLQIGLHVEVRPSEAGVLIEDLNRGRFDLCLLQLPELYEPHLLSWFFSSDRVPRAPDFVGANRWRIEDPGLDRALEVGRANSVRARRRQAYSTVLGRLNRQLPVIPLFHEDTVALVGPRARGFRVPRDGRLSTLAY